MNVHVAKSHLPITDEETRQAKIYSEIRQLLFTLNLQKYPISEKIFKEELKRKIENSNLISVDSHSVDRILGLLQKFEEWHIFTSTLCLFASKFINSGRHSELKQWIEKTPEYYIESTPLLRYWYAESILMQNPLGAKSAFSIAMWLFRSETNIFYERLALSGLLRTLVFLRKTPSNKDEIINYCKPLLLNTNQEDESSLHLRCDLLEFLIWFDISSSKIPILMEKISVSENSDTNKFLQLKLRTILLIYYILWSGDLTKASIIYETSKFACKDVPAHLAVPFHCATAILFLLQNKPASALNKLNKCVGVNRNAWSAIFYGLNVITHSFLSNTSDANKYIQLLTDNTEKGQIIYPVTKAWQLWLLGNNEEALRYIDVAKMHVYQLNNTLFNSLIDTLHLKFQLSTNQVPDKYFIQPKRTPPTFFDFINQTIVFDSMLQKNKGIFCYKTLCNLLIYGNKLNLSPWWSEKTARHIFSFSLRENIEPNYVKKMIRQKQLAPEKEDSGLEIWPWPIKVYTFGQFELKLDGITQQSVNKGKPMGILKALVSYGNKPVHKTIIADWLWPDIEGDKALHNLDTNLNRLRKILKIDHAIELNNETLSINPHYCWVDRFAFERLFFSNNINSTKCAQRLYKGHLFESEREYPWMIQPKRKLNILYLQLVRNLIGRYRNKADKVKCLESALSIIDNDQLSEILKKIYCAKESV